LALTAAKATEPDGFSRFLSLEPDDDGKVEEDDFTAVAAEDDTAFLTLTSLLSAGRPDFEPKAMKSPGNPSGLDFEDLAGKFFPRSMLFNEFNINEYSP